MTSPDQSRNASPAGGGSNGTVDDPEKAVFTAAISSTYKVIGEFADASGAGVLGKNDASTGTPIGVEGAVPNASGGYGLSTPDDARIEGALDTTGSHVVSVDGNRALFLGAQSSGNAGNVVAGHASNDASGAAGATVGGGGVDDGSVAAPNVVSDDFGTVSGGSGNLAGSDDADSTNADHATVGGGSSNEAGGPRSTVAGGSSNVASGTSAAVGGGSGNEATGSSATIGGGDNSVASGQWASVGGGFQSQATGVQSVVGGGQFNRATARFATATGGDNNLASGESATIPGGAFNDASGHFSFAAGHQADAAHAGSFVVGDSSTATVSSQAADEVRFQAGGDLVVEDGDVVVESGSLSTDSTGADLYLSSDQSIDGSRTRTTVEYDTVVADDFGGWDGANNEYVVQEPGDYHVDCSVTWFFSMMPDGTQLEVWVSVGGGDALRSFDAYPSALTASKTLFGLSAGEAIRVDVAQYDSDAHAIHGNEQTAYLSIAKVG